MGFADHTDHIQIDEFLYNHGIEDLNAWIDEHYPWPPIGADLQAFEYWLECEVKEGNLPQPSADTAAQQARAQHSQGVDHAA